MFASYCILYWAFPLTAVLHSSTRAIHSLCHTHCTRAQHCSDANRRPNIQLLLDQRKASAPWARRREEKTRKKKAEKICWWGWRSPHAVPASVQCVRACFEHTSFWSKRHTATATLTLVMFQVCVIDVLPSIHAETSEYWIFKCALNRNFVWKSTQKFVCAEYLLCLICICSTIRNCSNWRET